MNEFVVWWGSLSEVFVAERAFKLEVVEMMELKVCDCGEGSEVGCKAVGSLVAIRPRKPALVEVVMSESASWVLYGVSSELETVEPRGVVGLLKSSVAARVGSKEEESD